MIYIALEQQQSKTAASNGWIISPAPPPPRHAETHLNCAAETERQRERKENRAEKKFSPRRLFLSH